MDKRLYSFRRRQRNGLEILLTWEFWATDEEAAMRMLKLTWGKTARQGWYARDVTDDLEFRTQFGYLGGPPPESTVEVAGVTGRKARMSMAEWLKKGAST